MAVEDLTPFPKGKSGNPGGRPKIPDEVKAILKLQAPNALQKLLTLMESSDERIAFSAASAILDRAWGKPSQAVEHSGPDGEPIEVNGTSDLDVARRLWFLLSKAERSLKD